MIGVIASNQRQAQAPMADTQTRIAADALRLWLDAKDSATVFTDLAGTTAAGNGDTVLRWNDKSGLRNDALAWDNGNLVWWSDVGRLTSPADGTRLAGMNYTNARMMQGLEATGTCVVIVFRCAENQLVFAHPFSWVVDGAFENVLVDWDNGTMEYIGFRGRAFPRLRRPERGRNIAYIINVEANVALNPRYAIFDNETAIERGDINDGWEDGNFELGLVNGFPVNPAETRIWGINGDLFELRVYNRPLTAEELTGLRRELASKWAVTNGQ